MTHSNYACKYVHTQLHGQTVVDKSLGQFLYWAKFIIVPISGQLNTMFKSR